MAWQTLIVVLLIAAAGAYLARVAWQSVARRRAGACGGCGTCPAAADDEPQVVQVGALATRGPQTRDETR